MSRRNPNGYGCVTKLKGNRSRPWVVKVTVYDHEGNARQQNVGYAADEAAARTMLAAYNNNPWDVKRETITLVELFNHWKEVKLPKLSAASQQSLKSAFKHCSKYYGVKYRTLKSYQMQDTIDNCGKGYSTQGAIKALWGHLDKFAFEMDIIDKMYSQLTAAPPIPDTNREPFTMEQVNALWELEAATPDPWVESVLIYLYTGFRLNEILQLPLNRVDFKEWTITAGIKTRNGKDRVVPIHDRIKPFIQNRAGQDYLFVWNGKRLNQTTFYDMWNGVMNKIGVEKTPHEARHTFETFLDNAGGNRKCIDLLMGHKSKDTGNRVYNHKTLQQLRETIALLK